MSEFITWFEKRYNVPYPGEKGEPYTEVFARLCDAGAEWATICANKARNGTAKFIRAEKRRVRSQKHKEVVACDLDAIRADVMEKTKTVRAAIGAAACPTVSQLALVKEAKGIRITIPQGSDIQDCEWLDKPEEERRKIVMSKAFL
jgi:hypothetical protein